MTSHPKDNHYRWNFTVNLIDGATYQFGSSFISASTILPLFISKLTPSLWPIGLLSVITSAGWFLPQIFAARITERFAKMKTIVIGWGLFLERLPIWVMILSAVIARRSPTLALVLFLFSLVWYTVGSGVVAPSWMALVAKIFSPEKRGSFLGLSMFIGVGMGALGSVASAWLLESYQFPVSFVILFAIAAGFMTISWAVLALTKEPVGAVEPVNQNWPEYRKDLLGIIKKDQNFRRFIITNVVNTLGAMGMGFMTISAIQTLGVSDATVGLYTLFMLLGQTAGNIVLGWMADRFGHKLSLEIGLLALFLVFALAVFVPTPTVYFLIFALMGINLSSGIVSGMLVVWEFCETSRVPTYAGLVNTTRGIVGLAAPLIATQLAQFGFIVLFSISTGLTLIGLLMLRFWVREPRWQENVV